MFFCRNWQVVQDSKFIQIHPTAKRHLPFDDWPNRLINGNSGYFLLTSPEISKNAKFCTGQPGNVRTLKWQPARKLLKELRRTLFFFVFFLFRTAFVIQAALVLGSGLAWRSSLPSVGAARLDYRTHCQHHHQIVVLFYGIAVFAILPVQSSSVRFEIFLADLNHFGSLNVFNGFDNSRCIRSAVSKVQLF